MTKKKRKSTTRASALPRRQETSVPADPRPDKSAVTTPGPGLPVGDAVASPSSGSPDEPGKDNRPDQPTGQAEQVARENADLPPESLDAARARYFDLFDLAPAGYVVVDEPGLILEANLAAASLLGVPRGNLVKLPLSRFILAEDQNAYYLHHRQLMKTGAAAAFELRLVKKNGTVFRAHLEATYAQDPAASSGEDGAGKPVVRVVLSDITGRKRHEEELRTLNANLERRVRELTTQLEAANKELEAFSFSVSHDLRAPLRAIEGFSGIVIEDYGGKLGAEGERLLGVVRTNATKMSRLIDDLLSFSRTGRGELRHDRLEMGLMARSAFAEIVADPEARTKIDFTVRELPEAEGDAALVRQVWVNLLSNAVKFSARKERSVIVVTGALEGGQVVYRVRDNGAGFDMQYAGKLFGVFQRLHTSDEFVGTGIGLALVQRIVLRHGGRVWAEAEVGKGATFSFTLPSNVKGADLTDDR